MTKTVVPGGLVAVATAGFFGSADLFETGVVFIYFCGGAWASCAFRLNWGVVSVLFFEDFFEDFHV